MRARAVGVLAVLAIVVPAGCSAGPEGFEVRLLAGGGEQDNGTGADAALPPSISGLTSDGKGTLWGIAAPDVVFEVRADGEVRSTQVSPDGGGSLKEIAAASDGRVFVLPDLIAQREAEAVVLEFVDDQLVPAVGVPVPDSEGPGPLAPDGTHAGDAQLGYVSDIAVDDDGRLLLVERLGAHSADATFLVRRVEHDGRLATVAGQSDAETDGSFSDDEARKGFFPAEGTEATSLPIYDHTALAAGSGEQVYLQTTKSVLAVDDGTVTRVLGGSESGERPPGPDSGPMTESVDALSVDYRSGLLQLTLAVNAAGGILANTDPLTGYDEAAYRWIVDGGSDRAQAVADAAGEARNPHPTIYVSPDGDAMTVSAIGGPATWLDDDTIAVAATQDGEAAIIVTIDLPD